MLFNDLNKTYLAVIRFGRETTTGDFEGKIIAEAPVPVFNKIKSVSKSFIGNIKQVPPVYSAIKINGQRAYVLARKGEIIDMPERIVTIYDLKIKKWASPDLCVEVKCSSGTYIRSLAHDFGKALNNGGHLSALRRTKIGDFDVTDAISIEEFEKMLTATND